MSLCDTTCTYTFFSVRHDKIWVCEGREWTFANVCLFSQPCDRSASHRVTLESIKKSTRQVSFLSLVDNYMISDESAYSLLFVSGSCFVCWRRWAETLQTHFSVVCADRGSCCLLILTMFFILFQNLAAKLIRFPQNLADFWIFLLFHDVIILFLLLQPLVYVIIECNVTHNLSVRHKSDVSGTGTSSRGLDSRLASTCDQTHSQKNLKHKEQRNVFFRIFASETIV